MTALAQRSPEAVPGSTDGLLRLVVDSVAEAAPDIRSLVLRSADGTELPSFTPGSHLVLQCGTRRNAYSLTGPGFAPDHYGVSVLHLPHGRGGSTWVHNLVPGDIVSAAPARSDFPPVLTARHHVLVAGGIGITPMLSHARAAVQWGRSFELLYSYREGRGAHVDEVRELCGDRLREVHDPGRTRTAVAAVLAEQPLGAHVYVCGPAGLIDAVLAEARQAGWPDERVHLERFTGEELPPGRAFTARLRDGRDVAVPSGTSLLEALLDAGLDVPNLCRQGVCGECRLPVRAGRLDHRDHYLTPEERDAGGSVMACVSRAAADTDTLELEL